MSASIEKTYEEADELPIDGADAWFGLILIGVSGIISIKSLIWAGTLLRGLF